MPKITLAGGPSSALGQDPAAAAPAPPDPTPGPGPDSTPPPSSPASSAPKAARGAPSLAGPKADVTGSGGVTVPKAGTGGE